MSIDDDLLTRLREEAERRKRPLRAVANEALRAGLTRLAEAADYRPFEVRPYRLGLKPGFRGMSLNQLYDQIEAESVDPCILSLLHAANYGRGQGSTRARSAQSSQASTRVLTRSG